MASAFRGKEAEEAEEALAACFWCLEGTVTVTAAAVVRFCVYVAIMHRVSMSVL